MSVILYFQERESECNPFPRERGRGGECNPLFSRERERVWSSVSKREGERECNPLFPRERGGERVNVILYFQERERGGESECNPLFPREREAGREGMPLYSTAQDELYFVPQYTV